MKKLLFIKEFIMHFKSTGSLIPSSKFLTKSMVDEIDFQGNSVIVELGPGTGVFTREILKRKNKDTKLIVIELNEAFYEELKEILPMDENTFLINGCASKLENILKELKVEKIDYVISGLPFLNFKPQEREAIFKEINKILVGKFILFQYTKKVKDHIEGYFRIDKIKRVFLNFPPAYVFVATKKKI